MHDKNPLYTDNRVPRIHADPLVTLADLEATAALDAVRRWRESKASLLGLWGPTGTGKSLAAAWAVWDWRVSTSRRDPWGAVLHCPARAWIAAPHLARLTAWSEDVQQLERTPMLVVDDLGEEEATPKSLSLLSALLTTRFAEQLPTILTTNLDGKTFRTRYGERIIDRIRECGLDEHGKARWWVRCDGQSLRGRVAPSQVPAAEKPEPEPQPIELSGEAIEQMSGRFLDRLRVVDGQESETP